MTVPLLSYLQNRASTRGLVHVREEVLLREVGATREVLAAGLQSLEGAGAIRILSPLPYLVLRIRKWPGNHSKAGNSDASAYSSSKLLHTKQLNSSYRQTGAHGPIDAGLLSEILETLGETDGKSFEKAVELYSPHVIRSALERVRRAQGIRKSRTALFRHLLPRLAREFQHPT